MIGYMGVIIIHFTSFGRTVRKGLPLVAVRPYKPLDK